MALHGRFGAVKTRLIALNVHDAVLRLTEGGCDLLIAYTYETDMAEGLKARALEGHGLAFLPASSVRQALKSGRLVPAAAPAVGELTMEVRIYRERPEVSRHKQAAAQALWACLQQSATTA